MDNVSKDISVQLKSQNAIWDILKFILAIAVVAIHAQLFPKVLFPWLRIAVPMFFMMSSFFLFSKIKNDRISANRILMNYTQRNVKLYFFWFILLLPITLYVRSYFSEGIALGVLKLLRSLFFGGTFIASWYISASIIAAWLIHWLSTRLSNKLLMIFTFCIYIMVCLRSSYYPLIESTGILQAICTAYEAIFTPAYNSFPVALFWVCLGKCFADGSLSLQKTFAAILMIVSAALLYLEWSFVSHLYGTYENDCYFMLAPLCVGLFALVLQRKPLSLKNAYFLRKSSTIIYASHASVIFFVNYFTKRLFPNHASTLNFIITSIICIIACFLINALEKKKAFVWLKYSH